MSVEQAIRDAEQMLPGRPAPEGEDDPRWQALIRIGEFVKSDPEPVWAFIRRWGSAADLDLRSGVAVCLLEHLLEHHFLRVFPRVVEAVRSDPTFAGCFLMCWPFGQSEEPGHRALFEELQSEASAHAV